MPVGKSWQVTAGSVAAGLALAAGVAFAAGPWDSGQRTAERRWAVAQSRMGGVHHQSRPDRADPDSPAPAPSAPGVLPALTVPARGAAARPLTAVLPKLLADSALGTVQAASVLDATSGQVLYESRATQPMTPASTIKIATAVAALSALGPDFRLETRALADPGNRRVVLLGGGDPTLTARPADVAAPTDASLLDLATRTARALAERHVDSVTLIYDTSLYTGPVRHPIGRNENLAPVSALMADAARTDDSTSGDTATRHEDPAAAAARVFAAQLREHGIEVIGAPAAGRAAAKAERLAEVRSAPLAALVERMLTHSDNDLAEALARATALASGQPASFAGGGRAVAAQLTALGLDARGARFADGSGLDRADQVPARLLTQLLAKAADPAMPQLRPVLTGLPVAGFTGTLSGRYEAASPAAGLVRAKTGTLSKVNTLAGTVVDARGRLLTFAFLASGTTDRNAAQKALDRLAAAVSEAG
ncbi:D-alanyl-D-alanine carboxypeptidase/D-alanyl-D-alanine-endopeptidase [Streptomyces sp. NPDC006879]|uniref:D-alanyl-D-alanine carboxypeptidase/D-alanyl-D-alanine endopeptidase n=1 Tax=Streptomyces sp. NPDC006879 TaxID=3364767 RepID=UPI0036AC4EE5